MVREEKWIDVSGHSGRYQVSNLGRLRSVSCVIPRAKQGDIRKKGRLMRHEVTPNGYARIQLRKPAGGIKNYFVHTLVAMHFLSPRPSLAHSINHVDGHKLNNRWDNLDWATQKENTQHAYDTKLCKGNSKCVIACIELGLNAKGYRAMCKLLSKLGHANINNGGLWAAINKRSGKYAGLTFVKVSNN